MNLLILLGQLFFLSFFLFVFLLFLIKGYFKFFRKIQKDKIKILIILGSGGHTTEMLLMLKTLDINKNYEKIFIIANDDNNSEAKLKINDFKKSKVLKVIRSRSVGQSYFTSIFTTLISIIHAFYICIKQKPVLILCNGPGTCIPFCLIAKIINSKTLFIESFCRTQSLSLSGKIACKICDEVLVQWPDLSKKYKNTKYLGALV